MAPKLKPTKRPLRYSPTAWDHSGRAITWNKGEEKGIDVLLALSMTLGALRTGAMRSKPVSQLLVDLGVVRSHSRPHVSNDNPFSEAQFKTIKYCPLFPERFDSIEQAREFCVDFFGHYNHIHHHSGIALHTPASIHYGTDTEIRAKRQATFNAAFAANPIRFRNKAPLAPQLPEVVWINQPHAEALDQSS